MAGEIQLNSTTMATESSGSITLSNVDSATNRTNLGLGSMATQNANAVAITGGTINTVQPATGQSLTIKDEDGNTAITVGTDNTATDYLSLNFGSYNGGSGSLTGNTLSDFEQGTWTATLTPQTSGTITLSTNTCSYTKIGNSVTITGYLIISGVSSPTGFLELSTLPFTIGSRRGTLSLIGENLVAGNNILNLWSILVNGNTSISIYKGNGVNPSSDSAQMIQTGSAIWFTGTYFV